MIRRVLVCEDEDSIREFVVINLRRSGYEVTDVNCGEDALKAYEEAEGRFDIALLDIMMPGIDGFQVCKKLRERSATMGIIMLSAKSEDYDKITGLNVGADDYVTKPFNPLELMARVKSQIRRYTSLGAMEKKEGVITTGGLSLDTLAKELTVDGEKVKLTATEYKIVNFFMKNLGRVFSTGQIYEAVWNEPAGYSEKTVTVHINRMREKIEINPSEPRYLKVVWGQGYKMEGGN